MILAVGGCLSKNKNLCHSIIIFFIFFCLLVIPIFLVCFEIVCLVKGEAVWLRERWEMVKVSTTEQQTNFKSSYVLLKICIEDQFEMFFLQTVSFLDTNMEWLLWQFLYFFHQQSKFLINYGSFFQKWKWTTKLFIYISYFELGQAKAG